MATPTPEEVALVMQIDDMEFYLLTYPNDTVVRVRLEQARLRLAEIRQPKE